MLGFAAAQSDFDDMADLLELGYYNSAARIEGPELIEHHPEVADAHFLYASALYLTGDAAPARQHLDIAATLAEGSTDPRYTHLNGLLRAEEGDLAGALRLLENAFLRSQDYGYAMDWGRVAWLGGVYDEAITAYRAAADTTRGQREVWPHLNLGRLFTYQNLNDDAIAAYTTALEVFEAFDAGGSAPPSPAYVEAFYRLGALYEAADDLESARSFYQAARTTDPNYQPAREALDRLTRLPNP
jgi:tetratricopeptide (TPR) repeat protein